MASDQLKVLFFSLVVSLLFISGCSHNVVIQVNAIADESVVLSGKKYVLTSGMYDLEADDLYFKEFSAYFERILQEKDYQKVADLQQADIEIRFKYGISQGATSINTFSTPIYEYVGGETYTITETSTDSAGQITTKKHTIRIPTQYQQTGTAIETQSYTVYNRTASLEARTVNKENAGMEGKVIWNITIYSVGEISDLRQIMPYLATAAAPYIGKNSSQQQTVILKRDDPKIVGVTSSHSSSALNDM